MDCKRKGKCVAEESERKMDEKFKRMQNEMSYSNV